MEAWQSGLTRRTRNAVGEKSPRRFKSSRLRLRHDVALRSRIQQSYGDYGVTQSAYHETKLRRDAVRLGKDTHQMIKKPLTYYVYSLKCADGYYVGCTDDLSDRIKRHRLGQVPATAKRLPISLAFYFAIPDKHNAFAFEKYLKSGSGRAFVKKHLI